MEFTFSNGHLHLTLILCVQGAARGWLCPFLGNFRRLLSGSWAYIPRYTSVNPAQNSSSTADGTVLVCSLKDQFQKRLHETSHPPFGFNYCNGNE
eukprot:4171503-Amphidinium_carterae.1